jgi:PBP1b-binding outer membrane lipoprotein LpoB
MKKLLSILFIFFLLTGCGNNITTKTSTPSDEVRNFFSKYTSLDQEVVNQLNGVINEESMTDTQKAQYLDVFKRQYKDLKHNIIDEQVNDNNATVSVKIEVYDYYTVIQNANTYLTAHQKDFNNAEGTFDERKFWDYKLEQLQTTTSRRPYSMDLTLTKIDNN